jgi:hypothetical protein
MDGPRGFGAPGAVWPPRGSGAAAPGGALRAIDSSARPCLLADLRSAPPEPRLVTAVPYRLLLAVAAARQPTPRPPRRWAWGRATRPCQQRTARAGRAPRGPQPGWYPSPPGWATLGDRLRPLGLDPATPPPDCRPGPVGPPAGTGPVATRRQRPRRRITPNTNTSTTAMISTHNHVDMAASLVGAGRSS